MVNYYVSKPIIIVFVHPLECVNIYVCANCKMYYVLNSRDCWLPPPWRRYIIINFVDNQLKRMLTYFLSKFMPI